MLGNFIIYCIDRYFIAEEKIISNAKLSIAFSLLTISCSFIKMNGQDISTHLKEHAVRIDNLENLNSSVVLS